MCSGMKPDSLVDKYQLLMEPAVFIIMLEGIFYCEDGDRSSCESLLPIYQATLQHIPEDHELNIQHTSCSFHILKSLICIFGPG
jgi:hypothetical protein